MIVTPDLLKLDKGLHVHYLLGVRGWKYSIRDNDFFVKVSIRNNNLFFKTYIRDKDFFDRNRKLFRG